MITRRHDRQDGGDAMIDQLAHHITPPRKHDQRDDGKRQAETQHDLAKNENRVGSRPIAITINDGTIVTSRRIHGLIWRCKKPCMITCPAIVPTEAEDKPDASSERANTTLAAEPNNGSNVWWASSIVPTWSSPD